MPKFTLPDGTVKKISAKSVMRARPSLTNEISGHPGHTGSALFKPLQLVLEDIDTVGAKLQKKVPSFVALPGIDDRALWVDAKQCGDAEAPRPSEAAKGVQSVVPIGGVRLRVLTKVKKTQKTLDAARAKV